jgi:hypothetical protein
MGRLLAKVNALRPEEAPALSAGHGPQARPGGLKQQARGIYARATQFHEKIASHALPPARKATWAVVNALRPEESPALIAGHDPQARPGDAVS